MNYLYVQNGYSGGLTPLLDADGKPVITKYFHRAWRTEVGSSLTAVHFYEKMGYAFKNGITDADEYGVVRLEKRKEI